MSVYIFEAPLCLSAHQLCSAATVPSSADRSRCFVHPSRSFNVLLFSARVCFSLLLFDADFAVSCVLCCCFLTCCCFSCSHDASLCFLSVEEIPIRCICSRAVCVTPVQWSSALLCVLSVSVGSCTVCTTELKRTYPSFLSKLTNLEESLIIFSSSGFYFHSCGLFILFGYDISHTS